MSTTAIIILLFLNALCIIGLIITVDKGLYKIAKQIKDTNETKKPLEVIIKETIGSI